MKLHNRKLQVYNDGIYTTSPSMSAVHNLLSSPSPPSGEPIFTQSAPPPQPPITAFDSFVALIVLVLLIALFFMGFLLSIYIRRFSDDPRPINNSRYHRRLLQDPPNIYRFNSVDRKGLDPEIVSSLPLFYYHDEAKYQIDCAICLGELQEQEVVKMIPYCKHVFHVECIERWLSMHPTCPVCRGTRFFGADCRGGIGGGCFLSVVDLVAEETADHGASELHGGSRVRNPNTCDDVTREGASMGIRRSSSCTVLNNRLSLQRSWSF